MDEQQQPNYDVALQYWHDRLTKTLDECKGEIARVMEGLDSYRRLPLVSIREDSQRLSKVLLGMKETIGTLCGELRTPDSLKHLPGDDFLNGH